MTTGWGTVMYLQNNNMLTTLKRGRAVCVWRRGVGGGGLSPRSQSLKFPGILVLLDSKATRASEFHVSLAERSSDPAVITNACSGAALIA